MKKGNVLLETHQVWDASIIISRYIQQTAKNAALELRSQLGQETLVWKSSNKRWTPETGLCCLEGAGKEKRRGPKEHPEVSRHDFCLWVLHYLGSTQRKLSGKSWSGPFATSKSSFSGREQNPQIELKALEPEALKAERSVVAKRGREQNNCLGVWAWIEGSVWIICCWFLGWVCFVLFGVFGFFLLCFFTFLRIQRFYDVCWLRRRSQCKRKQQRHNKE